MTKKIVLAFSGGLDTSYWRTGSRATGIRSPHGVYRYRGYRRPGAGQQIRARAESLGTTQHHEIDVAQEIWDEFVTPLVWSHAPDAGGIPPVMLRPLPDRQTLPAIV